MHVVIFSHATGSVIHGPNTRWYNLGQELLKNGDAITLVGASWFHKYTTLPKLRWLYKKELVHGLNYVWVRVPSYSNRLFQVINQFVYTLLSSFLALFYFAKLDVDVVIASSPHPFSIFPAWLLARMKGVPLVYEVRDLWPLAIVELSGSSSKHIYFRLLNFTERFAVRNAQMVTSVKPGDYEYFHAKYGVEAKDFYYLPNGLAIDDTIVEENSIEEEKERRPLVVGYLGSMGAYYDLESLIDAAREMQNDDVLFRLVGDGDNLSKLKALAQDLDNVEFPGRVQKSEVFDEIRRFDIAFLGLKDIKANQYGISCNKIFEYMSIGKPIVASYRTNFDPIGESGCGITVVPGESEELVSAIRQLMESAGYRRVLGSRGRDYLLREHDFSKLAVQLRSRLNLLVSGQ